MNKPLKQSAVSTASGVVDGTRDAITDAADHPAVEMGARIGYAANAVMHVVIAFIAVQLALGHYEGKADQSGALGLLSQHGWGTALLWVGVVGWALLAVWQVGEALLPWGKTTDRLKAGGKAVVYLALAWTCLGFARHAGTSSSGQNVGTAKGLLDSGWGVALVVLIGLGVVGVGAYHVYKGWAKKFLEDLRSHPGRAGEVAGRVGYVAKGVALVVAGALFAQAGLSHDPKKASGLDGAFRVVLEAPSGRALVGLVGLGFAAYAVYSLFRARYARV